MNYNDLTYQQKRQLENGEAKIDRSGNFHKNEKTQKQIKKEKAANRNKQQDDDMLSAHIKTVEEPIIKAANNLYAGKNNVEGIYISKSGGQLPAKVDYGFGSKKIDPQYIYFYVKDKNGETWSSNVDARWTKIMHDYDSNYETNTCIDPEVLRKIRYTIFKLANAKMKARSENSRRYAKEKEDAIEKKHPYSHFATGYIKGAKKEFERRSALGESLNENIESKFFNY